MQVAVISFKTDPSLGWFGFVVLDSIFALYLLASLHDHGCAGDQVGRLLTNFGRLVVQTPKHRTTDLGQVGLHALPKGIHDSAKTV